MGKIAKALLRPVIQPIRNCECCGKVLTIYFSTTIYCNNCSVYIGKMKKIITGLKQRIKVLENKLLVVQRK